MHILLNIRFPEMFSQNYRNHKRLFRKRVIVISLFSFFRSTINCNQLFEQRKGFKIISFIVQFDRQIKLRIHVISFHDTGVRAATCNKYADYQQYICDPREHKGAKIIKINWNSHKKRIQQAPICKISSLLFDDFTAFRNFSILT